MVAAMSRGKSEARVVIARDLGFDAGEAAVQRLAWVGASGSGKSYGCGVFIEQLSEAGVPVIIFDTVGIWASLRLAADGVSPGLPFVIVGGDHADVPLRWDAGAKLARFLFEKRASAVIDVSDGLPLALVPFVADFCETLLQLVKTRRQPMTVVFDEGPDLLPEKAQAGAKRMVDAVVGLVRKGRNHSCGTIICTQRPQDVSKVAFDQAGTMFVGALFGDHERQKMRSWVGSRARGEEVLRQLDALPTLEPGMFCFWSPGWKKEYRIIEVAPKWTFDGSSTHPLSEATELSVVAPVDVKALRALLSPPSVVDSADLEAEATEHRLARASTVETGRELQKARAELARLQSQLEAAQRRYAELDEMHTKTVQELDAYLREVRQWAEQVPQSPSEARERELSRGQLHAVVRQVAGEPVARALLGTAPANAAPARAAAVAKESSTDASPVETHLGERALAMIAAYGPLSRAEVALYAQSSLKSGALMRALRAYEEQGLLEQREGKFAVTAAGQQAASPPDVLEGKELRQAWERALTDEQRKAWDGVRLAPKSGLTFQELCERTGTSVKSGSFSRAVRRLKSYQLLAGKRTIIIPNLVRTAFGL